jgi:hypothetical protein
MLSGLSHYVSVTQFDLLNLQSAFYLLGTYRVFRDEAH